MILNNYACALDKACGSERMRRIDQCVLKGNIYFQIKQAAAS